MVAPTNNQYFMRTHPKTGEVTFQGISTGKMTIHDQDSQRIVLKEAGHSFWSGRSMPQSYAPAQFRIVRVLDGSTYEGYAKVEQIAQFPVRSQA